MGAAPGCHVQLDAIAVHGVDVQSDGLIPPTGIGTDAPLPR